MTVIFEAFSGVWRSFSTNCLKKFGGAQASQVKSKISTRLQLAAVNPSHGAGLAGGLLTSCLKARFPTNLSCALLGFADFASKGGSAVRARARSKMGRAPKVGKNKSRQKGGAGRKDLHVGRALMKKMKEIPVEGKNSKKGKKNRVKSGGKEEQGVMALDDLARVLQDAVGSGGGVDLQLEEGILQMLMGRKQGATC